MTTTNGDGVVDFEDAELSELLLDEAEFVDDWIGNGDSVNENNDSMIIDKKAPASIDKFEHGFSEVKVAIDDPCRQYFANFFRYINKSDFRSLSKFLHDNCASDFQVHIKRANPLRVFDVVDHDAKAANSLVVVGVDACIDLHVISSQCVPDRMYRIKETVLRNRTDSMVIMCKLDVFGTVISKLKMDNFPVEKSEGDSMTIHKDSFKSEMVTSKVLVGNADMPLSSSTECTATLQLDKDRKISRLIFDYTDSRNTNWIKIKRGKKIKKEKLA